MYTNGFCIINTQVVYVFKCPLAEKPAGMVQWKYKKYIFINELCAINARSTFAQMRSPAFPKYIFRNISSSRNAKCILSKSSYFQKCLQQAASRSGSLENKQLHIHKWVGYQKCKKYTFNSARIFSKVLARSGWQKWFTRDRTTMSSQMTCLLELPKVHFRKCSSTEQAT